jgi:hypothetical protein
MMDERGGDFARVIETGLAADDLGTWTVKIHAWE